MRNIGIILTKVYNKTFDNIINKYGFMKRRKIYWRVVNNEILQTLSLFKPNIVPSFTINIGIFPLYIELLEESLYEGNYRLGEFLNHRDTWWDYNPFDYKDIKLSIDATYKTFIQEVIPVFERVKDCVTYKEHTCEFERELYGRNIENSNSMMWVNLKLHNFNDAVKIINSIERQNYEAASSKITAFTKEEYSEYLKEIELNLSGLRAIRSAIENNDKGYIESILQKNIGISNAILKRYR